MLPGIESGEGRSTAMQAFYQLLALLVTLVVASVCGVLTGKINISCSKLQLTQKNQYSSIICIVFDVNNYNSQI